MCDTGSVLALDGFFLFSLTYDNANVYLILNYLEEHW